MSVNGKRDGFAIDDLIALAEVGAIKPTRARRIVEKVEAAVGKWVDFAAVAGVEDATRVGIGQAHRQLQS